MPVVTYGAQAGPVINHLVPAGRVLLVSEHAPDLQTEVDLAHPGLHYCVAAVDRKYVTRDKARGA